MAETAIERLLASPATAEFHYPSIRVEEMGLVVAATGDSQNDFGAMPIIPSMVVFDPG